MMDEYNYRMFGGITNEEAKDQLENRNKKYDKYLIIDGPHPVVAELKDAIASGSRINAKLMGLDAIQKVYRFANGFGASVIRATFSMNCWESAEIEFQHAYPKSRLPKSKRLKKKWIKNYPSDFRLVGDVERFAEFGDLERQLEEIKNS